MKFKWKREFLIRFNILFAASALFGLTACLNVFDPIDNPGNNAQYLSAARSCFDRGELACAREYYGKLGTNEVAILEAAFVSLEEAGAGMEEFIRAFGDGSGGNGITKLANAVASGAGSTKRETIFQAYRSVANLSDPSLRGFGKFITALTLAAEILAESSGNDGILTQADLASNPSGCLAAVGANCNAVGLTNASYSGALSSKTSLISLTRSLGLLNAAFTEVVNGLNTLGATGKFSTGTGGFAQGLTSIGSALGSGAGGDDGVSRPYIQLLLQEGVGN